jgi:hypothetical protein
MLSLDEFDKHLSCYKSVMQLKEITLSIFYKQFKMTYDGNSANFLKVYQYFKSNSKHLHNIQLNLF